jgi:hypothetical protein
MNGVIPPSERRCERCGRVAVWDDDTGTWVAVERGGERERGDPHCLHEWDINGDYSPIEGE